MRTACGMLLLAVFSAALVSAGGDEAAKEKNLYVSTELGFSIETPNVGNTNAPIFQVAAFLLPPENGFAGNVNIQKQAYDGSIEAYDKLSAAQITAMKFTLIKRTLADKEVTYEYKGQAQGRELHWYSRAVKHGNHVLLVTATALERDWADQKAELVRSVDSFRATE